MLAAMTIRRGVAVLVTGVWHIVDDILPSAVDCKLCGSVHINYRTRRLRTHNGRRTQGCQVVVPTAS